MGIFQTIGKALSPIAKAVNREVGIRGAEPRKGNFAWMAGLPSKKVLKPIVVNAQSLKALSNTDPITWAIKATRKAQVTGCDWNIVRDTEQLELELDRWYSNIMNNLNPWGFEEVFHPMYLSAEIHLKASTDIKNILAAPVAPKPVAPKLDLQGNPIPVPVDAMGKPIPSPAELAAAKEERKKQLKWYFESLKRKIQQDADQHALIVKRIFDRPNGDDTRTFRAFLEVLLEDLLVYDAGVIVKNKNALGELAEMYLIPGQDVKLYRNPDRTLPKSPEPAYVWEDMGTLRAEYTKDELVYIMCNPQQNGYGMSPLEVAAYIITASLYADEYNIDFFKHSNVPPAIFNMGKNISNEQRMSFQAQWDNEVAGKGLHRMMFINAADTPEYIPIRNMNSRDMQMMEYLKWTLSIKCACYQISPQDIGFVQDFHRTTAQTQKELTKEKGIKNLLSLLETYFNTEIVKREFPFKDVKFQWQGIDLSDEQVQSNIDIADINNGIISRNDRRKRLGLPAVEGGDVILVNVGQQFVPIEELVPPEETVEQDKPTEISPALQQATGQPAVAPKPIVQPPAEKETIVPGKTDATGDAVARQDTINSVNASMNDEAKRQIVRMVVQAANEDKITKAMDMLKSQGLGDNEIKLTLEK